MAGAIGVTVITGCDTNWRYATGLQAIRVGCERYPRTVIKPSAKDREGAVER
jgi:hypothetical protein